MQSLSDSKKILSCESISKTEKMNNFFYLMISCSYIWFKATLGTYLLPTNLQKYLPTSQWVIDISSDAGQGKRFSVNKEKKRL